MRLLHEIAIFQTVKSKVIISLFETVRLSVSILLRNLYNSLNSIKEKKNSGVQDYFHVCPQRGTTLCDFLFSRQEDEAHAKWSPLLSVDPIYTGDKTENGRVVSLKINPFILK